MRYFFKTRRSGFHPKIVFALWVFVQLGLVQDIAARPTQSPYLFHKIFVEHRTSLLRLRSDTPVGAVFHSGFLVSSDGLVLCAARSLTMQTKVALLDEQGHSLSGRVVDVDKNLGIALLRFPSAVDLPALSINADADPRLGDWLVALGHDAKGKASGIAGGVSRRWFAKKPAQARYYTVDLHAAAGSPLLNLDGDLVAIALHEKGGHRVVALSAQSFAGFVMSAAKNRNENP